MSQSQGQTVKRRGSGLSSLSLPSIVGNPRARDAPGARRALGMPKVNVKLGAGDHPRSSAAEAHGARADEALAASLLRGCKTDDLARVIRIVEADRFPIHSQRPTVGEVHCAAVSAANGSLKTLKYLVESCDVDPDLRTPDGSSLVSLAARSNSLECARYLVETCGADPFSKNDKGISAARVARDLAAAGTGGGSRAGGGGMKEVAEYLASRKPSVWARIRHLARGAASGLATGVSRCGDTCVDEDERKERRVARARASRVLVLTSSQRRSVFAAQGGAGNGGQRPPHESRAAAAQAVSQDTSAPRYPFLYHERVGVPAAKLAASGARRGDVFVADLAEVAAMRPTAMRDVAWEARRAWEAMRARVDPAGTPRNGSGPGSGPGSGGERRATQHRTQFVPPELALARRLAHDDRQRRMKERAAIAPAVFGRASSASVGSAPRTADKPSSPLADGAYERGRSMIPGTGNKGAARKGHEGGGRRGDWDARDHDPKGKRTEAESDVFRAKGGRARGDIQSTYSTGDGYSGGGDSDVRRQGGARHAPGRGDDSYSDYDDLYGGSSTRSSDDSY